MSGLGHVFRAQMSRRVDEGRDLQVTVDRDCRPARPALDSSTTLPPFGRSQTGRSRHRCSVCQPSNHGVVGADRHLRSAPRPATAVARAWARRPLRISHGESGSPPLAGASWLRLTRLRRARLAVGVADHGRRFGKVMIRTADLRCPECSIQLFNEFNDMIAIGTVERSSVGNVRNSLAEKAGHRVDDRTQFDIFGLHSAFPSSVCGSTTIAEAGGVTNAPGGGPAA